MLRRVIVGSIYLIMSTADSFLGLSFSWLLLILIDITTIILIRLERVFQLLFLRRKETLLWVLPLSITHTLTSTYSPGRTIDSSSNIATTISSSSSLRLTIISCMLRLLSITSWSSSMTITPLIIIRLLEITIVFLISVLSWIRSCLLDLIDIFLEYTCYLRLLLLLVLGIYIVLWGWICITTPICCIICIVLSLLWWFILLIICTSVSLSAFILIIVLCIIASKGSLLVWIKVLLSFDFIRSQFFQISYTRL